MLRVKSLREVTCQDVMNSGSQERSEAWNTAVLTKVVQKKSVKACATMPKGSLGIPNKFQ